MNLISKMSSSRARQLLAVGMAAALVVLAPIGCKDKSAERLSSIDRQVEYLQKAWENARTSLESGTEGYNAFTSVTEFGGDKLRRRLESHYNRDNKEEVLSLMETFIESYDKKILSKLDQGAETRLKRGVTRAKIVAAFEEVDADYQAFIAAVTTE